MKDKTKPLRKVYVLQWQEKKGTEIKKGDIFTLKNASPGDCVEEGEILIANEDAVKIDPPGNADIQASLISHEEMYENIVSEIPK